MKRLDIFVRGPDYLRISFIVERKRVNKSLVDLTSEAMVKQVESFEDLDSLEIPQTLLGGVVDRYKDAQWVEGHRDFVEEERKMCGTEFVSLAGEDNLGHVVEETIRGIDVVTL